MPRKTKEDALKTRERILASALYLFSEKGYERTTFTDIASRLKLTKGAVYWHFDSKEGLLVELVNSALEHFRRDIDRRMPDGELTYPAVAAMMVDDAIGLVSSHRGVQFFRLMHSGVTWSGRSMSKVREEFLTNGRFGPKQAFERALENDRRAGRVNSDVRPDEAASVSMAVWDGLVLAKLDGFLTCDLASVLHHAFSAVWDSVRLPAAAPMPPLGQASPAEANLKDN